MNTKTKLRRAQDFSKYEGIYKKLEEIYLSEFAETARKKNKRLWCCLALMLVVITVLTVVFIKSLDGVIDYTFIVVALVAFISMIIVMVVNTPKEKEFVNNFKQRIIGTLLKEINPKLNYYPVVQDRKDILSNYKMMGFEPSNCGIEHVDDEITGILYDNIDVRVSNVCIRKRSGKNSSDIFNGLFGEFKVNKNIDADIRILLPTTYYLGNASNCEKIQMDNSEFEKQFNIYTDNKIITNQILTSDIMEQLKSYYEKYGMMFELVIKNGKACIRIETGVMFESVTLKNTLHKEDTFIYYSVLNFTFDLLKDIYNIIENTDI